MADLSDRQDWDRFSQVRLQADPAWLLSQAATEYLRMRAEHDGVSATTISGERLAIWDFVASVGSNCPVRELAHKEHRRWLHRMRTTPIAPRKRGEVPKHFTAGSVSAFLACEKRKPPKKAGRPRSPTTLATRLRTARKWFGYLGLKEPIPPTERPRTVVRLPFLPKESKLLEWWAALHSDPVLPRSLVRPVVGMQALCRLTGMRLGELISAYLVDLDGHWLMIRPGRTKRNPRIVYISGQALAIARKLRDRYNAPARRRGRPPCTAELAGPLLPDYEAEFSEDWRRPREPFAGWTKSANDWNKVVGPVMARLPDPPEKPHQACRQLCANWLRAESMLRYHHADLERLQMGHGGNVVFTHYLDLSGDLAETMERYTLPAFAARSQDGGTREMRWPEPLRRSQEPSRLLYDRLYQLCLEHDRQRAGLSTDSLDEAI